MATKNKTKEKAPKFKIGDQVSFMDEDNTRRVGEIINSYGEQHLVACMFVTKVPESIESLLYDVPRCLVDNGTVVQLAQRWVDESEGMKALFPTKKPAAPKRAAKPALKLVKAAKKG